MTDGPLVRVRTCTGTSIGRTLFIALPALALAALVVASLSACTGASAEGGAGSERSTIVLASTTSTEDSGLFGELIPAFEAAQPSYEVQVVAVGTGQALELGRNKDADVLLVHAEAAEEEFVREGHGTERADVMYNDFVLVGPAADPAHAAGGEDAAAALTAVAGSGSTFVSRGDDSGTHAKELSLWESAGVRPQGDWYLSVGQGMGDTLKVADEKRGYTVADRATFLSMRDALDLRVVLQGDPALFNQYGVIPVKGATNAEGARALADWLVGEEAQAIIARFGVETYGEPLFVPNASGTSGAEG